MPRSFTGPESFYSSDEAAWWASVDKALKGIPRQKLFGTTEDGLEIAPIYERRKDTSARSLRPAARSWTITQRVDIPDPAQANQQIIEDLEGGADGVELIFQGAGLTGGSGIDARDLSAFESLLNGVQPGLIKIRINAGRGSYAVGALLVAYLEQHGIDPASVRVALDFDPFAGSLAAQTGSDGMDTDLRHCLDVVCAAARSGLPFQAMNANGEPWHNAGATPAQELGLVLASAAAQLRQLEETRISPVRWSDQISLTLVADADQFGTIAKARAMRALWSCVLEGAHLPQAPVDLHMRTSFRMLTRRDPWVNLLRNTVAVFAAGIGGADSICVLPHTFAVGLPDRLARRLARNTQSILLEESNLAKVMDPAAGSGAIEDRTEKLCAAAWSFFQEIEAVGGLADALKQGLVQTRIDMARSELETRVALRKRPITGVSEFPNLSETPVSVLSGAQSVGTSDAGTAPPDLPEAGNGDWTLSLKAAILKGAVLPAVPDPTVRDAVRPRGARISEPFERLRAMADRFEEMTAAEPCVFLASLGSLAQFTARATWAANAFAAGGIKTTHPAVFGSLDEMIASYKESGAKLVCLVSSDGVYESEAIPAASALKAAGAKHLYLAGRPGEREIDLRDSGIDTFLFAGCDLLVLLSEAHALLARDAGLKQNDLEVLS